MSDPNTQGPDDDLGSADPITGIPGGDTSSDLDDDAALPDDGSDDEVSASADPLRLRAEAMDTVTNDAVAGETVLPGAGDANQGPTGGAPGEVEPILPHNDLADDEVVGLDDQA
ncbi:hypothetical protein QDR37_10945 [Amnibacterium sp. CER49]|uniref:hypothetical protein n=1 Tax=Amnibacterium sp. CER49 TaxID=3039161 RepID=UPI00244D6DA5|nr:hypothetical protein [Amnibacterium sp. CER49]MDH2444460.1 hypothetical protein [Amnibacterium sp. CER49]